MSDLQKAWAKKKLELSGAEGFNELDEEEEEQDDGYLPELPEGLDDDSSSASSASSTGTVVPTPSRNLFARPLGYVHPFTDIQKWALIIRNKQNPTRGRSNARANPMDDILREGAFFAQPARRNGDSSNYSPCIFDLTS